MIRLFALCCLLLSAAPAATAEPAQQPSYLELKKNMVIIHSMAELNNHLEEIALRGQTRTNCLFMGNLRGEQPKQLLISSRWVDYSKAFSLTLHPDRSVVVEFSYHDNARLLAAHRRPELLPTLTPQEQQALEVAQQRIAQLITPGMSDYDKARVLHDDLVNRAVYDLSADGACTTLLLTDKGVCETYSRTLWLLLRMANIPCHIVVGHTNEDHAWNLACIGGEWYHIDATWDDPAIVGSDAQILTHNYFLVTDAQIACDHSWVRGTLPISAKKDALYYRTNARYFTNYGQMWQNVAAAIAAGETEYECYLFTVSRRKDFERSLQDAVATNPQLTAIRTWSAPEITPGVIRFTFDHSGTPATISEEAMQMAGATIKRAQQEWQNFDPQAWFDSIDFSPIRQELEHIGAEAGRQLDHAAQYAKEKAAEWWNIAEEEVRSWF